MGGSGFFLPIPDNNQIGSLPWEAQNILMGKMWFNGRFAAWLLHQPFNSTHLVRFQLSIPLYAVGITFKEACVGLQPKSWSQPHFLHPVGLSRKRKTEKCTKSSGLIMEWRHTVPEKHSHQLKSWDPSTSLVYSLTVCIPPDINIVILCIWYIFSPKHCPWHINPFPFFIIFIDFIEKRK